MNRYLLFGVAFTWLISSCTVEITQIQPVYIDSIAITHVINEITIGQEHSFGTTYSPYEADTPPVFSWSSSNTSVATIDQNGLLTALDEGEVDVTLTAVVPRKNGTVELSDRITITVNAVQLERIALNRDYLELLNGTSATLTVTFIPENVKPPEIEWLSSNEAVVTVVDGVVTAHSADNAIITAKVKGSNIQASCSVKVNPIVLSSIRFEQTDTIKLEIGATAATTLIFEPENAENKNVIYSSSNPAIATVSANGVITALSNGPTGPGQVTITATSDVGGLKATCQVKVFSIPDLVTVSVEKLDFVITTNGSSGTIIPTLHNDSSKPIKIIRFRLLDRFNSYTTSILINETLNAYDSYPVNQEVVFKFVDTPRAEFTIEFEGQEYRRNILITP